MNKQTRNRLRLLKWYVPIWAILMLVAWILQHTGIISTAKSDTEPQDGVLLVNRELSTTSLFASGSLIWGVYPPRPRDGYVPLENWLDTLKSFENCPEHGIVDTNGLRSFGPYCYQQSTYLYFLEKYPDCMPYAEEGEWLNNLSDYDTQRCLTWKIVVNEPNGARNWHTSVNVRKGLGLPPI